MPSFEAPCLRLVSPARPAAARRHADAEAIVTARVLVVDDSVGSMALLQAQLSSEYLEVIPARDGAEALRKVAEYQPDLVLVAAIMPGLSGFDVCRRLRADPATTHLPVVLVTTLDQPEDRMAALHAGADDFMTKPIHLLTLMARVRRLTQSKMVIDELRIRGRAIGDLDFGSGGEVRFPDIDVTGAQVLLIMDDRERINEIRQALCPTHHLHIDRDAEDALLVSQRAELDLILIDLTLA